MVLEARDDRAKAEEAFKQSILSADPVKFLPLLYPDAVKQNVSAEDLSDQDLMEDSAGEWVMEEEMDPAEAEQFLRDLMANPTGEMTLTDIEQFE